MLKPACSKFYGDESKLLSEFWRHLLQYVWSDLLTFLQFWHHLSPVKRICVFEHSVMTNFNCACPAIQRGQGSGFLSEGSSWLTACMSEQRRFWRACADARMRRLAWTFAARIGDKYQIRLTRSILYQLWLHHQTNELKVILLAINLCILGLK